MKLNKEVKENFYFWLADGRVLKSATELLEALKDMDEKTYSHHVNSEKNDFANWIGEIYKDKKVAEKIRKAKKRKVAEKILQESIQKQNVYKFKKATKYKK